MEKMCAEERILRDQNRKLHERLELEKIRSDSLCRALSESESSLDGSFHMLIFTKKLQSKINLFFFFNF